MNNTSYIEKCRTLEYILKSLVRNKLNCTDILFDDRSNNAIQCSIIMKNRNCDKNDIVDEFTDIVNEALDKFISNDEAILKINANFITVTISARSKDVETFSGIESWYMVNDEDYYTMYLNDKYMSVKFEIKIK